MGNFCFYEAWFGLVRFSCSVVFDSLWPHELQHTQSITNSWSSLKLMSIELVMPPSHLILCRPLLLLPSIPPSIRDFSNESAHRMRWPKYWSFSFSIIPFKEHLGLISFRMDWLDLLAVQGTLQSLLQHYNSKASILQCSAFFIVQLSHSYMTTGKTIALTIQGFPCGSAGKESTFSMGDPCSVPGKDPLEKGKAAHSSILAWRIPWNV